MYPWALKIAAFIISSCTFISAQELDCTVQVVSQKITGIDENVFKTLEQSLGELLNTTAWTEQKFKEKEKIACSFIITLDAKIAANTYQANVQVQANRPVFDSSYTTPLLNHKDKEVSFTFLPNEALQYIPGAKNKELVAIAAYYAYLIIGLDADSFSYLGGSKAFKNAQDIVFQQGKTTEDGWSAAKRKINRYWIIEDFINYKDLRRTLYSYHRNGLDNMAGDPRYGMQELEQSILNLEQVHKQSSDVAAMHVFFDAKSAEITESLMALSKEKKKKMYAFLAKIAPGHLGIYKALE